MLNKVSLKHPLNAKKHVGRLLFWGLCMLLCTEAISQHVADTTKRKVAADTAIKKVPADSIISIINLGSQHDSAKINEVLAFKIYTSKSIATFNTLYVDGVRIGGLQPWKLNECDKIVFFKLDTAFQNLVLQFLESKSIDKTIIPVRFSLGDTSNCSTKQGYPIYIEVKQKLKPLWVWWVVVLLLMVISAIALYKNILKDDNNLYYSLGRTQLFYWSLIFVFAYLYICKHTGALPDIPGSVLTLIGISVATTAASKVIENKTKEKVVIDPAAKSEGWFLDILSDGSSINIQRFQNVIFNLVFGIIFIQKSIATNLLPDFDDNVLILLGISSGTYAGLKITEATKEQNQPAAPVGTDKKEGEQ